jgi:hypothetical protein
MIAWCGSRYFFSVSYRADYFRPAAEGLWIVTVLFGTIICLAVELVLVTPLLIAFSRYRWSWLNGWSAAIVGFLIGALSGGLNSTQSYGWAHVLGEAATGGMVGVIAAIIFRAVAVRTAPMTSG